MKLGNKVILSGAFLIAFSTIGLGASTIWITYEQGISGVRAELENLTNQIAQSDDPLTAAFYELSYADVDVLYVQQDGTQTLLQQSSANETSPRESVTLDLGYGESLVISKSIQPIADLVQTLLPVVGLSAAGFAAGSSLFLYLLLRRDSLALQALTKQANKIRAGEKAELVQITGSEDLRLLSLQLSDMVRQLEQNQANLRDFLYDSSHELKTPLTVIRGYVEILQKEIGDSKNQEKLKKIHNEALKMQGLISDLLFLAQIGGEKGVSVQPINLKDLFQAALKASSELQVARPIEISVDNELSVNTDESLLTRLIGNAISNIYRHTPAGSPISISATRTNDTLEIFIDDAGPGLPADVAIRPGARFHSSRSEQGSGLGLSIMHGVAEKLGAELEFQKSSLGGLRVKLTIPNQPS